MERLEITGGAVKGFKLSEDKQTGYLSVATTVYKKTQSHTLWLNVELRGDVLKKYLNDPIEAVGVNVSGSYTISAFKNPKDDKVYPKINVNADYVEKRNAAGSGLLRTTLTNVRLTDNLRDGGDNICFGKGVYNYPGEDGKAMWLDLSFWSDLNARAKAMKLKKGSTFDVDAQIDVSAAEKDGRQYINVSLTVLYLQYAAIPAKKKEDAQPAAPASTPAPAVKPEPTPAPEPELPNVEESSLDGMDGEMEENDFF